MSAESVPVVCPATIRRVGREAVEITWQDGHRGLYRNRYLRDNCPCAECREGKPRRRLPVVGGDDLYALQMGVVGRYAISIQWSDGHDSGIYSYETLRELCPCEQCRPPATRDEKA